MPSSKQPVALRWVVLNGLQVACQKYRTLDRREKAATTAWVLEQLRASFAPQVVLLLLRTRAQARAQTP